MNAIILDGELLDQINGLLRNFGTLLVRTVGLLPDSFINEYLTENSFDFLQYLNWFIPFYDFALITTVWLTAMGALFAGRVALRLGDKVAQLLK